MFCSSSRAFFLETAADLVSKFSFSLREDSCSVRDWMAADAVAEASLAAVYLSYAAVSMVSF